MAATKNIEIELKYPLLKPKELIEKLGSMAKLKSKDEYQKDTYYVPPHRDFLAKKPVSEWLRIRHTDDNVSLDYKKWHNKNSKKTLTCYEIATKISDNDALKNILACLDFKKIIDVEKKRTTWIYKDVLISIDNVTGLGHFLEIEANKPFSKRTEAEEYLYGILAELDASVGPQDFEGYPYKILEKKGFLS